MTIAHRGLKVKVKVVDQATAVGSTSIEFSLVQVSKVAYPHDTLQHAHCAVHTSVDGHRSN